VKGARATPSWWHWFDSCAVAVTCNNMRGDMPFGEPFG